MTDSAEEYISDFAKREVFIMNDRKKAMHAPFGGLGLRSIKTAIAATLTALLYAFSSRNPTFACIGAVFGLGSDTDNSILGGGNRLIGTIIGGFIGLGIFWIEHLVFPEGNYFFRLPLFFVGIIILISLSVYFRWPGGVQPGSVILCIILFNTPANHIAYALDRMLDTGIGVIIGVCVNELLTRERMEKWLHIKK